MKRVFVLLILTLLAPFAARASSRPIEIHQLLALPQPETKFAALTNPSNTTGNDLQNIAAAANARKLELVALKAQSEADFEPAFAQAAAQGALVLGRNQ